MSDMPPVQEFTLFPHLPPEIRTTIWRLALLEPRIIEVEKIPDRIDVVQYLSTTPAPSLLSVCRESRQEALNVYTVLEVSPTDFEDETKLAVKLFKESFPHLAVHPKPDGGCKICAKRAQQRAYINYRNVNYQRNWAELARGPSSSYERDGDEGDGDEFDFGQYLATLDDVQLPDVPLDTKGKYDYKKYCIKRLLFKERQFEAELRSTIVPFRTYISPSRDIIYLNRSLDLQFEFSHSFPPQAELGTNPQIPVQHLAANIRPVKEKFRLRYETDIEVKALASWAAYSLNIKSIYIILEGEHASTPEGSNLGKVIGFELCDVDENPGPILAYQTIPYPSNRKAQIMSAFKREYEKNRLQPCGGKKRRVDSLSPVVRFATVVREEKM